MKDKTRDTIIDDLLKKRPVGPPGGVKLVYTTENEYNYDRHRYVDVQKCADPNYGYEDATLFSLDLKSQMDVKNYVMKRWFEGKSSYQIGGKKSTVTRRANRIWNRICDAVRRQERAGGKGIYKVTRSYSSSEVGYVYSSNAEEAKTMANMFFPADDNTHYAVTFVEIGSVDRLYHYNAKIKESYENQIDRQKRAIEESKKRIEQYTNFMTMLSVLEGHQVAVETEV